MSSGNMVYGDDEENIVGRGIAVERMHGIACSGPGGMRTDCAPRGGGRRGGSIEGVEPFLAPGFMFSGQEGDGPGR